jgi:hypothetical protein
MGSAEDRVAEIVAARESKPAEHSKRENMHSSAPKRGVVSTPTAPIVPPARNPDGTFAKGGHPVAGFQPGVSGNPAGRPRMASALVKAGEEVDVLFPNMPRVDAAALALWRKAMVGDVSAFREIADRTEGKVTQSVEVGNKDGEAFEVNANGSPAERLACALAGIAAREAAGASDEAGGPE